MIICCWGNAWVKGNSIICNAKKNIYWEFDEWSNSTNIIFRICWATYRDCAPIEFEFILPYLLSNGRHPHQIFRLLFFDFEFRVSTSLYRCTFLLHRIQNLYSGCDITCHLWILYFICFSGYKLIIARIYALVHIRCCVNIDTHVLVLRQLVSCDVIWSLRFALLLALFLSFGSFSCNAFEFVCAFFCWFVCSFVVYFPSSFRLSVRAESPKAECVYVCMCQRWALRFDDEQFFGRRADTHNHIAIVCIVWYVDVVYALCAMAWHAAAASTLPFAHWKWIIVHMMSLVLVMQVLAAVNFSHLWMFEREARYTVYFSHRHQTDKRRRKKNTDSVERVCSVLFFRYPLCVLHA